ncbi:MAG TPA: Ig-like domain-containing protein [Allosphingosinicella sp.]|nr:Ig-like domain-containing protein [Allosphingosinicella sp.]
MANFNGTHKADTIIGTAQDDSIFGDNGNDTLGGGAGNDYIDGGNGSDLISGGAGDDVIDGGNGQDTIVYAGNRSDYRVFEGLNGAVVVRDLRSGRPDGEDRLFSAERIQFADGTFKLVDLIEANVAPVAADDSLTLAEDAGAIDVTSILLANDSDADGDSFQITAVSATSDKGATVTVGPDGKVSYDAGDIFAFLNDGETATDSFTYTITDATGATSTATATVTITGVGQEAPDPDAYFHVQEDATRDDLLELLTGWLDFPIVGAEGGKGTLGTVLFDGETLSFAADHDGSDHLNYDQHHETYFTVTGANGETATIMAVIEGVNDDIVAVDDQVGIGEGETSGNLWYDLIGNDQGVDSFLFEILSVDTSGTQGLVSFDAYNRTLTYSAEGLELAEGETITDSFTYVVDDGWGSTDTGTVLVTVKGNADGSVSTSMAGGESLMAAFAPAGEPLSGLPTWDLGQAQQILGAEACIA